MYRDAYQDRFGMRTAADALVEKVFPDYPEFGEGGEEQLKELKRAAKQSAALYKPKRALMSLKQAFGPRALPFFDFYKILFIRYNMQLGLGAGASKGFLAKWLLKLVRPILKRFKDDVTMARQTRDFITDMKPLLNKAENNPRSKAWITAAKLFASFISDVSALGKSTREIIVKELVYDEVKDPETGEVKRQVRRDKRGQKVHRTVKDPKTGKAKRKTKKESTYLVPGRKINRFPSLALATKKQIKDRVLRDEAPDIYAAEKKLRKTYEEIDAEVENFIKSSTDYTYAKEYIYQIHRHVNIGQDESTRKLSLFNKRGEQDVVIGDIVIPPGKAVEVPNHLIASIKAHPDYEKLTSGGKRLLVPTETVDEFVFPTDGSEPLSKEEFIKETRARIAIQRDISKQELLDDAIPEGVAEGSKIDYLVQKKRLENIDSGLTEDLLKALEESGQDIEHAAITDDMSLQSRVTRIFPTMKTPDEYPFEGRSVIMKGRYRGLYLDDVVNSEGRLIESRNYEYVLQTDANGSQKKVRDETLDPLAQSPHISVGEDGRLYLRVPGDRGHSEYRKALGTTPGASGSLSVRIAPPGFQVVKPGMPGYEYTDQRNAKIKNRTDKPIRVGNYTINPGQTITLGPEEAETLAKSKKFQALTEGGNRAPLGVFEDSSSGVHARGYYFEPQHFAKIREALGGSVSMSREASDALRSHFDEMAAAERATGLTFHLKNNTEEKITLAKAGVEIEAGETVTVTGFQEVKDLRADPVFRKLASERREDGTPALEVSETNLRSLAADEIGGFKEDVSLLTKQKQALAWLEANGDQGVLALDTGLGKTITSIAHMQRLIRDGAADEQDDEIMSDDKYKHTRGRFLYVAPQTLLGNMNKEIRKFLKEEFSDALIARLDVMSYPQFALAVKKKEATLPVREEVGQKQASLMRTAAGRRKGVKYSPWEPKGYVAIYFDEAHKEMIPTGKSASKMPSSFEAALSFSHPRKICLTASPVQREPMDAFLLSTICSDKVLYAAPKSGKGSYKTAPGGARKAWLAEKGKFKRRFTKSIGGRVVGLTDNPVDQTALANWVKRNMFYADKMEVAKDGEYKLKKPNRVELKVSMPPEMEEEYRKETKKIKKALRAMVAKFQDYASAEVDARGAVRMPIYERDPNTNEIMYHTDEDGNEIKYKKDSKTGKFLTDKEGNFIEDPNGERMPIISKFKVSGTEMGEIMEKLIKKNPKSFRFLQEAMQKAILLSIRPDDYIDGLKTNPKLDESVSFLENKPDGTRTLFFTDDVGMVTKSAIRMSKEYPQGIHVAALDKEIQFYKNGKPLESWDIPAPPNVWKKKEQTEYENAVEAAAEGGSEPPKMERFATFPLPFDLTKKRAVRAYPGFSTDRKTNKRDNNPKYESYEVPKMVFDLIVTGDPQFMTASLLGTAYAEGHNLQAFDTVIHLDRDTWSNENMKQRTARSWRQGQSNTVDVVNIDFTFEQAKDQLDRTLDEIRSYFQALESDLFDQIIKKSQETLLGKEWFEMAMKNAGQRKVDLKLAETVLSPYLDAGE